MGVELNDSTLYNLYFVDDQIVIAPKKEGEFKARKLFKQYEEFELTVNYVKTYFYITITKTSTQKKISQWRM